MKRIRYYKTPIINKEPYAYYEQSFLATVGNINNVQITINYCDYYDTSARVSMVKRQGWHIGWTNLNFLTDEVTKFLKDEAPMPKHIEAFLIKEVEKSEYFQRASKKKAQHVNSKRIRQEWTKENA